MNTSNHTPYTTPKGGHYGYDEKIRHEEKKHEEKRHEKRRPQYDKNAPAKDQTEKGSRRDEKKENGLLR